MAYCTECLAEIDEDGDCMCHECDVCGMMRPPNEYTYSLRLNICDDCEVEAKLNEDTID